MACTVAIALGSAAVEAADTACAVSAVECCAFRQVARPVAEAPPAIGYHIWPLSLTVRPDAVAKLVALRPRSLRFSLGPNWRRLPHLEPNMSDAELDAYVAGGFAQDGQASRVFRVLYDIRRRTGAKLLQVVWDPPPLPGEPAMPAGGKSQWRRLKAQNVPLMARFLVAQTKHVSDAGVALGGLQLSNEPDGSWNLAITPADYVELVRAVRAEAGRRGVALPAIYGPGTGQVTTLVDYFADPALARGILEAVDVLSVHGWDDATGADRIAKLEQLFARLAATGVKRPLAFTEFAVGRPVLSDPSDRMNARKRVPDNVAGSPAYGAATIRELTRLLEHGVGEVFYWEFQDQPWGRGLLGLLDTDGREKPVYGAVRSFVAALDGVKATRVAGSADGRVSVLLGLAGGATMVAANPGDVALDVLLKTRSATPMASTGIARCGAGTATGVRVPSGTVATVPLAPL